MPRLGMRDFYAVLRAMLSGRYAPQRGVHYFQTASLQVVADEPVAYETDGELGGDWKVLEFARHGSLMVMSATPAMH